MNPSLAFTTSRPGSVSMNNMVEDISIEVTIFLDIKSIVRLLQTSKWWRLLRKKRIVWIKAIQKMMYEESLMPFTFDLDTMDAWALECCATRQFRILYHRTTPVERAVFQLNPGRVDTSVEANLRQWNHEHFYEPFLLPGGRWLLSYKKNGAHGYIMCWNLNRLNPTAKVNVIRPAARFRLRGRSPLQQKGLQAGQEFSAQFDRDHGTLTILTGVHVSVDPLDEEDDWSDPESVGYSDIPEHFRDEEDSGMQLDEEPIPANPDDNHFPFSEYRLGSFQVHQLTWDPLVDTVPSFSSVASVRVAYAKDDITSSATSLEGDLVGIRMDKRKVLIWNWRLSTWVILKFDDTDLGVTVFWLQPPLVALYSKYRASVRYYPIPPLGHISERPVVYMVSQIASSIENDQELEGDHTIDVLRLIKSDLPLHLRGQTLFAHILLGHEGHTTNEIWLRDVTNPNRQTHTLISHPELLNHGRLQGVPGGSFLLFGARGNMHAPQWRTEQDRHSRLMIPAQVIHPKTRTVVDLWFPTSLPWSWWKNANVRTDMCVYSGRVVIARGWGDGDGPRRWNDMREREEEEADIGPLHNWHTFALLTIPDPPRPSNY